MNNNYMNYVLDYVMKSTNYSCQNMNNIYNLIYHTIKLLETEEKKQEVLLLIKTEVGLTFLTNYNAYCLRKGLEILI